VTGFYIPPPPPGLVVRSSDDLSLEHGIKGLVYGRSGIGKTRLMATMPKMQIKDGGHGIVISAEAGMLSLRDTPINVIEINKLDDLNRALDYLMGPAGNQYWHIGMDSISEIAEKILANAKANTKDGRKAYGDLADQMWATIRAFRDIKGKNVIMTAKAEYVKDDNGVTRWGPMMPGKSLTQGLPYFFDFVFAYASFRGAAGEHRSLQTSADMTYEAKDRSGKLDFFEYPDLSGIFNKIYGIA
jgi:hypothetical protein